MTASDRGSGGLFAKLGKLLWGGRDESVGPPAVEPRALSPLRPTDDHEAYRDDDTLDAETLGEVLAQLEAGRKIEAIKIYREATGVGLKDGKEAVERLGGRKAA